MDTSLQPRCHEFCYTVQVYDTDCFGVMWHGAYTKWMEQGRVQLLESMGIFLSKPSDPEGYIYPVVDQHFEFRAPCHYQDQIRVKSWIHQLHGPKIVFVQEVFNGTTQRLAVRCTTTCLVLDMQWKPFRHIPAELRNTLEAAVAAP